MAEHDIELARQLDLEHLARIDAIAKELTGFEEGEHTFVIEDFAEQFLDGDPKKLGYETHTWEFMGGINWLLKVDLDQTDGKWGIDIYVKAEKQSNSGVNLPCARCGLTLISHNTTLKKDICNVQSKQHEVWDTVIGWDMFASRSELSEEESRNAYLLEGAMHLKLHIQACLQEPPHPSMVLESVHKHKQGLLTASGREAPKETVKREATITDKFIRVTMPVTTPGMDDCVARELHTYIANLLLKREPKKFKWMLYLAPPDSRVEIDIDRELAAMLPILAPLLESSGAPEPPPHKVAKLSMTGRGGNSKESTELEASQASVKIPFEAPASASACGLACVLLILEGNGRYSNSLDIFCSRPWGPTLMAQTAWIASFVGINNDDCHVISFASVALRRYMGDDQAAIFDMWQVKGSEDSGNMNKILLSSKHQHSDCRAMLQSLPPERITDLMQAPIPWLTTMPLFAAPEVTKLPDAFIQVWLHSSPARDRLDLRNACLTCAQALNLLRVLPCNTDLVTLHISFADYSLSESTCVLSALYQYLETTQASACGSRLKVLGAHHVQAKHDHIIALAQLCGIVKGQVSGLWFSFRQGKVPETLTDFLLHGSFAVEDKLLLMDAIANCLKLRVICMPQFEALFRHNVGLLTPLQRVESLRVLVHMPPMHQFSSMASRIAPGVVINVVKRFRIGKVV